MDFKFNHMCSKAAINPIDKYSKLETEKLAAIRFASSHAYSTCEDERVEVVNSLPILHRNGYDKECLRLLLQ